MYGQAWQSAYKGQGGHYMKAKDIYTNMLVEIDMIENVLEDIRAEIRQIQKKMLKPPSEMKGISYDGMPKGNADHTSLDRIYGRLKKLYEEEEHYQKVLDEKMELKQKLIEQYREITGLENQVLYLRDVRGYKLQEIADELGYTLDYIKHISCKLPKDSTLITLTGCIE
jgi:hypothetical protein